MKTIDHLVYCVPNLQEGIQEIKHKFGVEPSYGGRHLEQGTHNALLNIGNQIYFEILAPDPDNKNIDPPRWMGIDLLTIPKFTRWGVKSDTLKEDLEILKKINPSLAKSKVGKRQKKDGSMLNWELSIPLPQPEVEAVPFLIDWKGSEHPTNSLSQHCELLQFSIHHPQPDELALILKSLNIKVNIQEAEEIALVAEIKTPKGKIIL